MNKNFLTYMLLLAIVTSQFSSVKANNSDMSYAALGGIVLGALFSAGCTSFILNKRHEKNIERSKKKHQNEIEDLAIQITILKERLAAKEEAQKEQIKNEEAHTNTTFFGKLTAI